MTTTTSKPSVGISPDLKWTLTQIHATAFIIAWFGCVVASIFIARYLRRPQHASISSCFWFQAHRILNFLALGLMLFGLLTIFIAHEWRWLGPVIGGERNGSSTAWHTLFGVLSVGLAVIQPLNALFRCNPSHENRQIFNWIHRGIGAIAWIFAATCIGIACRLFGKRFTNPNSAFALCLTIIIGSLLFIVFMEILVRRQEIRIGNFVTNNGEVTIQCNSSRLSVSYISLLVFGFILICLVLALCFMIWLKKLV